MDIPKEPAEVGLTDMKGSAQLRNGEVINIRLDTTLPRSYNREFTLRGTVGMYEEHTNSVFLDGDTEYFETEKYAALALNNAERFYHDYIPLYWSARRNNENAISGHGGLDVRHSLE